MGRTLTFFLIIAAAICLATNPSQDEYISWLKQQVSTSAGDQFGSALVALFGGPVFNWTTTRKDFLVFSEFETNLGDGPTLKFLGVAHHFFPLVPLNEGHPPSHVVTTDNGGHWFPEDGYVWINNPPIPGDLRVRWQTGRFSTIHPHVVAADREGRWLPENGYTWVVNPPVNGDFRVRRIELPRPLVTDNEAKANCSYVNGRLFCPSPGTGLCWAKGHNPYFNEPPFAIDVGTDKNSPDYGHPERCSGAASRVNSSDQIRPSSIGQEAMSVAGHTHSTLAPTFAALAPHLSNVPDRSSPASSGHCNTNPYLCTLYGLIMPEQHYPDVARVNHIEGRTVVAFWLDESGNLLREAVYKSSGHAELDSEALEAVKRAAPFPPPPVGSPHGFVTQMEFPPK